jgi:exonuclease SbcC
MLHQQGFTGAHGENSFLAALITEDEAASLDADIKAYKDGKAQLARDLARLARETEGIERLPVEELNSADENFRNEILANEAELTALRGTLQRKTQAMEDIAKALKARAEAEALYMSHKALSDTANGEISGAVKLTFEAYAQAACFNRVLRSANKRLSIMSRDRFQLIRRETPADKRQQSGLDLDVIDYYTGKARDVRSLSGGQSFLASLSLALGLSDIVSQTSGGVKLDAMFIDEGFGSLDSDTLETAITALQGIAGRSMIGIISHVAELRARIDKQILVKAGLKGSEITQG